MLNAGYFRASSTSSLTMFLFQEICDLLVVAGYIIGSSSSSVTVMSLFQEICYLLVAAGYFRARIKGLSPFDKVKTKYLVIATKGWWKE